MGSIEQATSQNTTPTNAKRIETFLPSNFRAPFHRTPYAVARSALPTMIDQKLGIVPRRTMISVVATEAVINPVPHRASAVTLRCCSHESNSKHPARAGVKTVIANNVE